MSPWGEQAELWVESKAECRAGLNPRMPWIAAFAGIGSQLSWPRRNSRAKEREYLAIRPWKL